MHYLPGGSVVCMRDDTAASCRGSLLQAWTAGGHSERCCELLAGGTETPDFIITLGGRAAVRYLNDGEADHQAYWVRVWGARGLLWAGPGDDVSVLRNALHDDHWRVREMVCKVVANHQVGDLLDAVSALESDPIERVRIAAGRAAMAIIETEA